MTEFLVAEGEIPVNIHRRLQNVFEDNTLDYSNVCRWVRRLKDENVGTVSVADKPRFGRPSASVNPANNAKPDALIREDRCISLNELEENLEVSHGSAYNIVELLGFSKVYACWVPRELTTEHKTDSVNACTELLEQSQRDNTFFSKGHVALTDFELCCAFASMEDMHISNHDVPVNTADSHNKEAISDYIDKKEEHLISAMNEINSN
ncbi:uncharacterized protein LOC106884420 [Octopus bimaculoides]|uniref:uncharacterized protein LOC106884420 n=1 Tax=Octopus bimaculoides TaxID=37653 RepID=UPI00071D79B5|nr:uncharacterized protein LOC106884420 [Octopus bimaculoides]|eukprot:XP_014791283.1 PREDICTED: uncharacterized protein LOC106884420 [Octopus bimaculoides]